MQCVFCVLSSRVVSILHYLFIFPAFFFGVAQAFKKHDYAPAYATFRCFCIQLCSVLGPSMLQEAIMLVKYATLWLILFLFYFFFFWRSTSI